MNTFLRWSEERQEKAFNNYEAYFFGFMELKNKKNKTFYQKYVYHYAAWYCIFYEFWRGVNLKLRSKIEEKLARKALNEFYKTHKPPYSVEDECQLIAWQIALPEGRQALAKAMVDPIKDMNNASI